MPTPIEWAATLLHTAELAEEEAADGMDAVLQQHRFTIVVAGLVTGFSVRRWPDPATPAAATIALIGWQPAAKTGRIWPDGGDNIRKRQRGGLAWLGTSEDSGRLFNQMRRFLLA